MTRVIISFVFIVLATSLGAGNTEAQSGCPGKQVLTEKACPGDAIGRDEKALFELVTKYRAENKLPAAKLSVALSMVANRHLLDLEQNLKTLTHSWSNCPYDIRDKTTWKCSSDAPARLGTTYSGEGYETLYRTAKGDASPQLALEAWKKSTLHNSIILNLNDFNGHPWDEIGVAIDGPYAALWFGSPTPPETRVVAGGGAGLGVTFEQAVRGLSKLVTIERTSSTIDSGKWEAVSSDKKIKLEIFGAASQVAEATARIAVKLEPDGKLSTRNFTVLSTLLKNLLPDWDECDNWLQRSLKIVGADKTASRTQLVRGIAVEMGIGAGGSLEISVRPQVKSGAKEIF